MGSCVPAAGNASYLGERLRVAALRSHRDLAARAHRGRHGIDQRGRTKYRAVICHLLAKRVGKEAVYA